MASRGTTSSSPTVVMTRSPRAWFAAGIRRRASGTFVAKVGDGKATYDRQARTNTYDLSPLTSAAAPSILRQARLAVPRPEPTRWFRSRT